MRSLARCARSNGCRADRPLTRHGHTTSPGGTSELGEVQSLRGILRSLAFHDLAMIQQKRTAELKAISLDGVESISTSPGLKTTPPDLWAKELRNRTGAKPNAR